MWLDEYCFRSRGYGVHSPMLYRIIREAMMPRHVVDSDHSLYDALRLRKVGRRTATRLQNLFTLENYAEWRIDEPSAAGGVTVLTPDCTAEKVREIIGGLEEGAVCAIYPLWGCQRRALCRELTKAHRSMSAEKPRLMLYFARTDLRKQHIRI